LLTSSLVRLNSGSPDPLREEVSIRKGWLVPCSRKMDEPQTHSDEQESSRSEQFQLTKREKYIAAVAIILGFTFGVVMFAFSFGRQFSHSLEDWELQHNDTLETLRHRLELVTQEKQTCLEDDTQALELAELRGKLTARSTLVRQVEELGEETRAREQEYFQLRGVIDRQTSEMEMSSNAHDQLTERLARVSEQRSGLTRQLKTLSGKVQELNTQVEEYELQTGRYQDRIRQRESFLCKEG
jgi:hypothetical protein